MISIKQLNYALAVKKARHFKKASEACSVSQSALSTAISELENKLGLQIFERNNKKVLITQAGKEVLRIALSIQQQVDTLYTLSNNEESELSQSMSVGVIPTISPYLLPRVLPELRKGYPDFKLSIVEEQTDVLIERVKEGELDTAILALPYQTTGLHTFEFWQEDFFIVMHKNNPLASQSKIKSNTLMNERLLLLKDGHCLKDHALAACKLESNNTNMSLEGTSLNTLIQMVAGKMGTTLVPQMALNQLVHAGSELAYVPLSDQGPHRRIAFITRLNYANVGSIQKLQAIFQKQLSKSFT